MMRRIFAFGILCLFLYTLQAQLVYYDAAPFPLLGKATQATHMRYARLPDSLEQTSRPKLWKLSRHSAGMSLRFRTNSTKIAVRWEVLQNYGMAHMTSIGIKGVDLYCLEKNAEWRFVNAGWPTGKKNEATIISNMSAEDREFMLYLPLYDGVCSLSIGIDSLSFLEQPAVDLPVRRKPVLFYGTSILQGGCASRPGMAHTNIISRRLNRECINLGFSGNAFLDLEVAEVIAQVDASAIILDFAPNASVDQMKERMEAFYKVIRDKQPLTPVIFVEDPIFTHTLYDSRIAEEVKSKNQVLNMLFNELKQKNEQNIILVSSKDMLGTDGEATVDGIHFTDLGMMRYADLLTPVIRNLIE